MTLTRKIVGYGYSKLITLPKQWLTMNNIKKGDSLKIEQALDGKSLVIRKND